MKGEGDAIRFHVSPELRHRRRAGKRVSSDASSEVDRIDVHAQRQILRETQRFPQPGQDWRTSVFRAPAPANGWQDCDRQRSQMVTTSRLPVPPRLPARSPNLNAFAERFVRSIKESCLDRLVLFGESSLRRATSEFVLHYHEERNHQGLGKIIRPEFAEFPTPGSINCRNRPGGMLRYYHREAA